MDKTYRTLILVIFVGYPLIFYNEFYNLVETRVDSSFNAVHMVADMIFAIIVSGVTRCISHQMRDR